MGFICVASLVLYWTLSEPNVLVATWRSIDLPQEPCAHLRRLVDASGVPSIQVVGTQILLWHDDPSGLAQQWRELIWRLMAPVDKSDMYKGILKGLVFAAALPAPESRALPGTFQMTLAQYLWGFKSEL